MAAPRRKTTPATAEVADEKQPIDLGLLDNLLGYRLRRAQLAVFQDFLIAMKGFELRPAQFSVLAIIAANPGLKQSRVSEALGINRANFVALLDELEQRKLARRAAAPGDRRSNALYLTPKGEGFLKESYRHLLTQHEKRVEAVLGSADKQLLLNLLDKLTTLA
ncbi:MAG: MarR family transcriptional regulator [Ferrovibrio sp.]|uniref:MarR family winged helix-turn-helix transcriptional regulator n=1 Tax=Ferrovibrio sp. TaxID=1917215 RepID=UPI0026042E93|nr:MarR family transcriptional regulator [Ferrovibrio sp.]MCW0232414.1 MarR family transcriptional regulator [Ferrovibrio sp.]